MKMTLKQKLTDEEIALLEIVEDPIWLGEFLRNTSDGEVDKNLWPSNEWHYRDYQSQFLTDKTEFILYTGGRAIGKCQPSSSKIYTVNGYKKIRNLIKLPSFGVYALNEKTLELEQRRAVIVEDKQSPAYTLTSETGHTIVATPLHPILTPDGYKLVEDLNEGDYIAVMTQLPWESTHSLFQWHELRLVGYVFLQQGFNPEHKIKPRFKKIGAELEEIAKRLITNLRIDMEGNYSMHVRRGPFRHPTTSLMNQMRFLHAIQHNGVKHVPELIMLERLENIQVFLEAVFAQFGELSQKKITLQLPHILVALDFQELLLRFGIETRIIQEPSVKIETLDYRAAYRFWKTFTLPGVNAGDLPEPPNNADFSQCMRFERIVSKHLSHELTDTYAVHVYEHNNYISDNVFVHNSVVLEDKMVYDIVNSRTTTPVTPEMVLTTANQSQMTPLQNRLILRFTASKFLKDFLRNNINKSTGVMTFPRQGKPFILTMRIAGSRGENNLIGLHIPRIYGDEAQVFPLPAFTQLGPCYNGLI
jgi:hypothetical protein